MKNKSTEGLIPKKEKKKKKVQTPEGLEHTGSVLGANKENKIIKQENYSYQVNQPTS